MSERVNPVFFGTVKNEKIVLESESSKRRFKERLHQLEGKNVRLSISKRFNKRSIKQNSFYWGAIIPLIADEAGMLDEEVHEALRWMFLKDSSKKIPTVKSTAELTKGEFAEYIFHIQVWGSSFLGIEKWPSPEEWEIAGIYT